MGRTTLAWSHLCASWGLVLLLCSISQGCQVPWRRRGGCGSPACAPAKEGIYLISPVENLWCGRLCLLEVCQTASPPSNTWPGISGCLKIERSPDVFSRAMCGGASLCAATCALWIEAIKCSASQKQTSTMHRGSSAQQRPAALATGWWATGSDLVQRSTCKLYLPRLWGPCS